MASKKFMSLEEATDQYTAVMEDDLDTRGGILPLEEFLEHKDWAGLPLRPRQRLICKIHDNAINKRPLTDRLEAIALVGDRLLDTEEDPEVSKRFHAAMPHCTFFDADGDLWYDEEADWEYITQSDDPYCRAFVNVDPKSDDPLTMVDIMGRGSSKTTVLSAGVSSHQTYRILSSPNPHGLFGLAKLKPLRIQNVATSNEQAGEFFDSYNTIIDTVKWFKGRHQPPIKGVVKFGKHLYAERTSSNSKSGRGRDTVVYIHDEAAFNEKTDGPRSDKKLYTAIRAAVKTRAKGKGIVMVVSSPAEADGLLYELYEQASEGKLENSIVIVMASWHMIPGQSKVNYRSEYRSDEDVADAEYGAQFYKGLKRLLPYVREKFPAIGAEYVRIMGSAEPLRLHPRQLATKAATARADAEYLARERRYQRFVHVDTSEGGDRTAVVVLHVRRGRIVVDLVRAWDGEVGFTKELIPFLKAINKRVPIAQVSFDQFSSIQAVQDLEEAGITAVKTTFSQEYNDLIARNLRETVREELLGMYPLPEGWNDKHLRSLLDAEERWDTNDELWPHVSMGILRKEMEVANKTLKGRKIAAEAPTAGYWTTDDLLDCLMSALCQAVEAAGGLGVFLTLAGGPGGVDEGDRLPESGEVTQDGPTTFMQCPHHKGWVNVPNKERMAPCPECKAPLQVRL